MLKILEYILNVLMEYNIIEDYVILGPSVTGAIIGVKRHGIVGFTYMPLNFKIKRFRYK